MLFYNKTEKCLIKETSLASWERLSKGVLLIITEDKGGIWD